jgi:hypothetical protein
MGVMGALAQGKQAKAAAEQRAKEALVNAAQTSSDMRYNALEADYQRGLIAQKAADNLTVSSRKSKQKNAASAAVAAKRGLSLSGTSFSQVLASESHEQALQDRAMLAEAADASTGTALKKEQYFRNSKQAMSVGRYQAASARRAGRISASNAKWKALGAGISGIGSAVGSFSVYKTEKTAANESAAALSLSGF